MPSVAQILTANARQTGQTLGQGIGGLLLSEEIRKERERQAQLEERRLQIAEEANRRANESLLFSAIQAGATPGAALPQQGPTPTGQPLTGPAPGVSDFTVAGQPFSFDPNQILMQKIQQARALEQIKADVTGRRDREQFAIEEAARRRRPFSLGGGNFAAIVDVPLGENEVSPTGTKEEFKIFSAPKQSPEEKETQIERESAARARGAASVKSPRPESKLTRDEEARIKLEESLDSDIVRLQTELQLATINFKQAVDDGDEGDIKEAQAVLDEVTKKLTERRRLIAEAVTNRSFGTGNQKTSKSPEGINASPSGNIFRDAR